MGFLSLSGGVIRINLTEPGDPRGHWWADIKKTLSGAELDIAEGKKLQISATGEDPQAVKAAKARARKEALGLPVEDEEPAGAQTTVRMDTAAYRLELLTLAITDWNLTDELDRPLPLSPQSERRRSLKRLPPWAYDVLVARVEEAADEAKATPSKEDQADFR